MNAPLRESESTAPAPPTDALTARARPRGLDGWRGRTVLAASAIATAVVLLYYFAPYAFMPPSVGALYGYAFIGSLVVSVGGGIALMIRQNNPWWLLTLPWAVLLVVVLVVLAGGMGIAATH